MPKFYLTTAIDYSNGDPHLGHALEKVGADAIARYRRLRGDKVHFLMGMDEHSQSVLQAAARAGVSPQVWVDRMADRFGISGSRLECSNDDWIRTTEPRHARAVTELLQRIQQHHPDDLHVAEYEGLYCTGCEEFKQESQIVNGHCIEHPTLELIPTRERNHFFRLSRYGDRLLELISNGTTQGGAGDPPQRSRAAAGRRTPGYLGVAAAAAVGNSLPRRSGTDGIRLVRRAHQLPLGHRISRAGLRAALAGGPARRRQGHHPLPLRDLARHAASGRAASFRGKCGPHGYVQWEGTKMSKTAGTAVTLDEAIERHGPDALRYFLLREVGFEADGNFTWERFDERYTADLADGLGNLASRSSRHAGRSIAPAWCPRAAPTPLDACGCRRRWTTYARAMDALDLRGGSGSRVEPRLGRQPLRATDCTMGAGQGGKDAELDEALARWLERCARLAVMASPFIPGKAQALWEIWEWRGELQLAGWNAAEKPGVAGRTCRQPEILFPKPATV